MLLLQSRQDGRCRPFFLSSSASRVSIFDIKFVSSLFKLCIFESNLNIFFLK